MIQSIHRQSFLYIENVWIADQTRKVTRNAKKKKKKKKKKKSRSKGFENWKIMDALSIPVQWLACHVCKWKAEFGMQIPKIGNDTFLLNPFGFYAIHVEDFPGFTYPPLFCNLLIGLFFITDKCFSRNGFSVLCKKIKDPNLTSDRCLVFMQNPFF